MLLRVGGVAACHDLLFAITSRFHVLPPGGLAAYDCRSTTF
jgi:hypothetical protein